MPVQDAEKIDSRRYYAEYHGHPGTHLESVIQTMRQQGKSIMFLAGDSSLDNKYWFESRAAACNGYEQILRPPHMKQDVCYWLNKEAEKIQEPVCCVNTAVEATSLNSRSLCSLCLQDRLIRDNIQPEDVLIVSVGGNDIALAPVMCTCFNMAAMMCCMPEICLERCSCACPPNIYPLISDPGCLMCGLPGFITGLAGWPPGMGYFVDLFKNRVETYVKRLVSKKKPKKVVICMIYFLEESGAQGSWADPALFCLGYQCCPSKLQTAIRKVFELGTSKISIDGTEIIPFPLYHVLDGKTPTDYLQRVEPSPSGGRKMARALMKAVLDTGSHEFDETNENTESQVPRDSEWTL